LKNIIQHNTIQYIYDDDDENVITNTYALQNWIVGVSSSSYFVFLAALRVFLLLPILFFLLLLLLLLDAVVIVGILL